MDESQQIRDLMREERARGKSRRPIDTESERENKRLRRDYLKAIREGSREDFVNVLHALGLQEGSEEFVRHLRTWNEIRRS